MCLLKSRLDAASRPPRSRTLDFRSSEINIALTIHCDARVTISRMPQESLRIADQPGTQPGQRVLRLEGALVMTTMFEFQATVRADASRSLIIDFAKVPYVDSAGIGALVCAAVTRQRGGRNPA